jgi:hypothetical protein
VLFGGVRWNSIGALEALRAVHFEQFNNKNPIEKKSILNGVASNIRFKLNNRIFTIKIVHLTLIIFEIDLYRP